MALRIRIIASQAFMSLERTRKFLRAVATDVHFWIPLTVLAGGLLLLDRLR